MVREKSGAKIQEKKEIKIRVAFRKPPVTIDLAATMSPFNHRASSGSIQPLTLTRHALNRIRQP